MIQTNDHLTIAIYICHVAVVQSIHESYIKCAGFCKYIHDCMLSNFGCDWTINSRVMAVYVELSHLTTRRETKQQIQHKLKSSDSV